MDSSSGSLSGSSAAAAAATTYEARKAQEWNASQADKIHWEKGHAFRNQNYRQLFHQDGLVGTFSVRLLEAAELKRSYWSALALGPMKHLGLSKAHGQITSFVSFCLDTTTSGMSSTFSSFNDDDIHDSDRKMPAATNGKSKDNRNKYRIKNPLHQMPTFVSPIKQQDNNPVWTNCHFTIPVKKGVLEDGQPVRIFLRVDEDGTAIENIIPGIPSSGDRCLGIGFLDVTSLCLGQDPTTGRPSAGVIDAWVPIKLPPKENESEPMLLGIEEQELLWKSAKSGRSDDLKKPSKTNTDERNKIMGRVRILVTYRPHGMDPQQHDIVALEGFARQNSRFATCHSILPPLLPMHVIEVCEPWLLVEYRLPFAIHDGQTDNVRNNNNKACMRVHRNAVFVIERKNFLDATLNLALQPADLILSTPLGHGAREILGPIFVAGRQLMMPALLSSKLVWMAVRTTALASITGVAAAGSAFVHEGTNSLTNDGGRRHRKSYDENGKLKYVSL
jgi:hypothetical protein